MPIPSQKDDFYGVKLPGYSLKKPSKPSKDDDFEISVDVGSSPDYTSIVGMSNAVLASSATGKIQLSEDVVEDVRDRLLKDTDFVNYIRSSGTVPPFKETDLGRDYEKRIIHLEGKIDSLKKELKEALSKIDVLIQGFTLPD